MLKSVVKTTIFASFVFAANAPAQSLVEEFLPEDVADMGSPSLEVAADQACTNFTGNWKGTCTFNGGTARAKNLYIKQKNCGVVKVNHHLVPIGGQGGGSVTLPTFTVAGGGSSKWNAAKTSLEFFHGMSGLKLGTGDKKWAQGSGDIKMDGDKLVVAMTGKTSKYGDFKLTCSFTK